MNFSEETNKKIEELQSKVDFKIPLIDDRMDVGEHIKEKYFDCIILYNEIKNDYSLCVFPDGFIKKNYDDIMKIMKRLIEHYKDRTVYYKYSNDRVLLNLPVKRTTTNLTFYSGISNEDAERVLNNAKDIFN